MLPLTSEELKRTIASRLYYLIKNISRHFKFSFALKHKNDRKPAANHPGGFLSNWNTHNKLKFLMTSK